MKGHLDGGRNNIERFFNAISPFCLPRIRKIEWLKLQGEDEVVLKLERNWGPYS